ALVASTGLFFWADVLAREVRLWPEIPYWDHISAGALWLVALLFSLPLIAPILRKLRAIAALAAQVCVPDTDALETAARRAMFSGTLQTIGGLGLLLWYLILILVLWPPWPVLAV